MNEENKDETAEVQPSTEAPPKPTEEQLAFRKRWASHGEAAAAAVPAAAASAPAAEDEAPKEEAPKARSSRSRSR